MSSNRNEAGFSLIKMLLVLAVLAGMGWSGYRVLPVYNTYWKVQDVFDSVAHNLSDSSEAEIRARLPDIFHVQYIQPSDLPRAFYDHLSIEADGGHVEISSSYDVTVWLLGEAEEAAQDREGAEPDAHGMDSLRNKARLDFHFEPHAETP